MVGLKEMRNWFGRDGRQERPCGKCLAVDRLHFLLSQSHRPPLTAPHRSLSWDRAEDPRRQSRVPKFPLWRQFLSPIDGRLLLLCVCQCVGRSPVLCQHLQRSDLQDSSNWLLVVEEPLNSCLFLVCSCANYWAKRPVSWLSQQGSDDY